MEGLELADRRYSELWERLGTQTILVHFKKVNGEDRLLLGTRNMDTVGLVCEHDLRGKLAGFDKKSSLSNHNIPVVDLVLGDVRTFCVEESRLVNYELLGLINGENLEAAFKYYNKLNEQINEKKNAAKAETISVPKGQSLIDLI